MLSLGLGLNKTNIVGASVAPPAVLFLDETGLSSAAVALSVTRKLRDAYAGNCIRVRESAGNTELDIGFVDNELDTATLLTHCGANNGFIVTIYDQSGNARNVTQSTAANQPQIVSGGVILTGANSKPECRFDGSNDSMTAAFTLSQPVTVFFTFKPITWATKSAYDGSANISMLFAQVTATPQYAIYAGSSSTSVNFATGTPSLSTAVFNGASSTLRHDADSEITSSIGTASPGGVTIANRGLGGAACNLGFQEMVIYATAKNSTDQTTARNNINAFYDLW